MVWTASKAKVVARLHSFEKSPLVNIEYEVLAYAMNVFMDASVVNLVSESFVCSV